MKRTTYLLRCIHIYKNKKTNLCCSDQPFQKQFLNSGGTSTGADVAGWLAGWLAFLSLQKIGFKTAEARLAPGSTIQVYSDKATVQVYSNSTNS